MLPGGSHEGSTAGAISRLFDTSVPPTAVASPARPVHHGHTPPLTDLVTELVTHPDRPLRFSMWISFNSGHAAPSSPSIAPAGGLDRACSAFYIRVKGEAYRVRIR